MKEGVYKQYVLVMLMVLVAFNYLERHTFGLLMQQIKGDLFLSDTQLGLLTGIAFALFYSVMGIPIARWADRGNRVTIIAISAGLSGLAVALCGFAAGFVPFMLIRICVAVGEAGCVPPAHSLIADYFDRTERPRAVAIYKLGIPLSMVVGYFLSGWFNELYGWRTTFMLLGLPGLALAAITWLTLKEPRSTPMSGDARPTDGIGPARCNGAEASSQQPSVSAVCKLLRGNVTFRNILLGYAIGSFFSIGIAQWQAAFFIRSFGLQTGELGTWLAAIWGVGGFIGTFVGGQLASRYAARNERLQLRGMAFAYGGFGVVSAAMYLSTNKYLAFGLMGLGALGVSSAIGPLFATIQTLVPERVRAMSIAIIFLFSNLVGMGFGPLAAGALSDALRPWAGEESLRYALLVLCPGYIGCGWYLWRASKTVARDLMAPATHAEQ